MQTQASASLAVRYIITSFRFRPAIVRSVSDRIQGTEEILIKRCTRFDNNDVNIQVMLHETGHSLDAYGGYGPVGSTLFSKSETWHNAVAQDPKVPSNYSNTNYMEDLAETTVIAFYDVNVPGGVKQVQKGWQDIFTQFNTVKERLGDTLKPGGSCSSRPTNSVVVRVDDTKTPDKKPSVYAVKVVSG